MVVRVATLADVPALFAVRTSVRENHLDLAQLAERGVTFESVTAGIDSAASRTWVAEEGGRVCGFCIADGESGSISALFVSPDFEGRGCGRRLLQTAEDWLAAAGFREIWLQTGQEPDNRAHGFYRAAGWRMTGPADHGDVRYEKSLS
ncbi:MAG TPA: GNAT family N-acetyltransferase [Thermoanaerobaculia bacterium]|nr:GNAT family N-acetyltransferase [Thermoanaerobaculia bacterium]